jgi:citrate synthase
MDLDFPSTMIKAVPILARTAGLLGHLAEEQRKPIGFMLAHFAEEAIKYDPAN